MPPDPHEIEQLREVAKLPFADKLKWLAAAGRMAEHMEKQRAERLKRQAEAREENLA